LTCLVLGAGLPALYTVGLRQLAAANGVDSAPPPGGRALHRVIAYVLFAVVVTAIVAGLSYIILHGFGYTFGVVNGLPSIVKH
jgi:predicted secreted protein